MKSLIHDQKEGTYPKIDSNSRKRILPTEKRNIERLRETSMRFLFLFAKRFIAGESLEEALPVIKKAPLKYAAQSLLEGLKMTAFLYIPILNEPHITEEFQRTEKGRLLISAARGIFRALAYLVLLLTLLGFFGERKKWRQWIFIAAIIVYINLSYSLLFGWGRYNVPLIPLYIMFAVAGFAFIKKKLCGKGFIHE